MSNPSQESAINKIQKTLAIQRVIDNSVESDRDNTMKLVMADLVTHNVAMANLQDPLDKEDREDLVIDEEFPCPFRRDIALAVAEMCMCRFFSTNLSPKQKYKFTFVGLETNVAAAKAMAIYLIKDVYQESVRLRQEKNETTAFETKFRNDSAVHIQSLVQELKDAPELQTIIGKEEAANDKYIKDILGCVVVIKKNRPECRMVTVEPSIPVAKPKVPVMNLNLNVSRQKADPFGQMTRALSI